MTMNWYAVYTKPKYEDPTAHLLRNAGIEVLSPRIRIVKYVRKKYSENIEPLFPCYIFARFDKDMHSHMIRYTRGVRYVIGKETPIIVPSEIIDAIMQRMEGDFIRQIPEDIEIGDRIMIQEGPFQNFYGIFERNLPGRKRVTILLEALWCKVEIEHRSIKKA